MAVKNPIEELIETIELHHAQLGELDPKTIKEWESEILELEHSELSFTFAQYIKGANIKAHAEVILDNKDPEWNYMFARNIEGADIKAHEQVVLEAKNPKWCYKFATLIEMADRPKHAQVILDSKIAKWNYYYAHAFLEDGCDLAAHAEAIIESRNPEFNYKFARAFKEKTDIQKHYIAILCADDSEAIERDAFLAHYRDLNPVDDEATKNAVSAHFQKQISEKIKKISMC